MAAMREIYFLAINLIYRPCLVKFAFKVALTARKLWLNKRDFSQAWNPVGEDKASIIFIMEIFITYRSI